mmetsp:Transcript_10125/g.23078  ORF Transcript_10125/g.23078 Transcript_10125/m.23078 type:complete len:567 (-) Transcript_10125:125-1825(-)
MAKRHHRNCILITLLLAGASLVAVSQFYVDHADDGTSHKKASTKHPLHPGNHDNRTSFERHWNSRSATRDDSTTLPEGTTTKLSASVNHHTHDARAHLGPFERKWNSWNVSMNATRGDPAWEAWLGRCCGGYIDTHSGCRIARWYYSVGDEVVNPSQRIDLRDCDRMPSRRNLTDPGAVRGNDTVYVTLAALPFFVDRALDRIDFDFVLISGQSHLVPPLADETIERILENEHVLHFFCQNLSKYGGRDKRHPKLSPFPYGLKGNAVRIAGQVNFLNFAGDMENSMNKSEFVYAGPLTGTNAKRRNMPGREAERLPYGEFLTKVGRARYLLSPDGDRPECYRHYEALLLGTVPITELDPFLFRHLAGGPVVFANRDWNLTSLAAGLDPAPVVNRNLVLEEYWMDWVDMVAGVDLNWSDDLRSGEEGFRDGPDGSWAPIGDRHNEWVSVSDARVCVPYANLHPPNPEWGLTGEGQGGAVTRHVACCASDPGSEVASEAGPDAASNGTKGETRSRRYSPKWFDRESGWDGRTYDEAANFCSKAGMKLCPYDAYCVGDSVKKLSTVNYR